MVLSILSSDFQSGEGFRGCRVEGIWEFQKIGGPEYRLKVVGSRIRDRQTSITEHPKLP